MIKTGLYYTFKRNIIGYLGLLIEIMVYNGYTWLLIEITNKENYLQLLNKVSYREFWRLLNYLLKLLSSFNKQSSTLRISGLIEQFQAIFFISCHNKQSCTTYIDHNFNIGNPKQPLQAIKLVNYPKQQLWIMYF